MIIRQNEMSTEAGQLQTPLYGAFASLLGVGSFVGAMAMARTTIVDGTHLRRLSGL